MHHHAGVELDVGVQVAPRLQLGQHVDGRALDGLGELHQRAPQPLGDRAQQHRTRVVRLVDAVAEAHDALAALDGPADVGLGPVGRADGVEHVERPAGGPAVQRARQRPDGGHDRRCEVRTRRRHHARRERRCVEPVIDGEDHVLLDRPGVDRVRHLPGQHVEVIGGEAEVVPRFDGVVAVAEPVGGGEDRRHDRTEAERLVVQLVGADVVRRAPAELGPEHGHGGAQDVQRCPERGQRGQQRAHAGRQGPPPPHLVAEGGRGRRVGQLAAEEEVPDVLERAGLGQVDGGVLPVVEEAFLASDVADGRLGHDDTLEPGRDVPARLGGGPDAGDPHQVAQRHDAHAAVALDHRQVAVVVRGEAAPGGVRPFVGTEDVGPRRHPQPHPLVAGVAGSGGRPQQVPLGQDPDHLALVGHDDRAGVGLLHHPGRRRQGVVGAARHGGRGHQVAHDGFHTSTMPSHRADCKH